jgi:hypothetical protein
MTTIQTIRFDDPGISYSGRVRTLAKAGSANLDRIVREDRFLFPLKETRGHLSASGHQNMAAGLSTLSMKNCNGNNGYRHHTGVYFDHKPRGKVELAASEGHLLEYLPAGTL